MIESLETLLGHFQHAIEGCVVQELAGLLSCFDMRAIISQHTAVDTGFYTVMVSHSTRSQLVSISSLNLKQDRIVELDPTTDT